LRYDIEFTVTAAEDLSSLRAAERRVVEDAIDTHLRYEPTKTSKSRIKRLRGLSSPQYRLRVDEFRVFYDVEYHVDPARGTVIILAVKRKINVTAWLVGNEASDETSTPE
jgi:mRNA-degrading endonuclease RelE of RelBE toxin-antitoxin system